MRLGLLCWVVWGMSGCVKHPAMSAPAASLRAVAPTALLPPKPPTELNAFLRHPPAAQREGDGNSKTAGWILMSSAMASGALAGVSLGVAHMAHARYQESADPAVIEKSFNTAKTGSFAAIGLGVGAGVVSVPAIVILAKKKKPSDDSYAAYLDQPEQR